jgi:GGDEF domain-containing protein
VAAREISQTIWNRPGDDAFIAGLLQDIGEMILIEELGTPYIELLEKAFAGDVDLQQLEIEAMGFDHTELTSKLLDHWNLPESLVRTVLWNVAEDEIELLSPDEKAERQILYFAELIAKLLADGDMNTLGQLSEAGRDGHNLSKQRLDYLVEDLEEKVENLAEVLSLKLDDKHNNEDASNGYRELLDRAHQQLVETAALAAGDMLAARLGRASEISCSTEAMALAEQLHSLNSAVKQFIEKPQNKPLSENTASTNSSTADNISVGSNSNDDSSKNSSNPAIKTSPIPTVPSSNIAANEDVDSFLMARLRSAVDACRQARCSLSLMMVELNYVDQIKFAFGSDGYKKACRWLETLCRELEFPGSICLPLGETAFALILPDCDRREVAGPANELIHAVQDFVHPGHNTEKDSDDRSSLLSISIGAATVAMPPKNFPPESLVESASRCLYGSRASGGGVLKSIEIY